MRSAREQCLNFNIKLTEQLLGVRFTGSTLEEKEEFYTKYSEQQDVEVQNILNEVHDEFNDKRRRDINMDYPFKAWDWDGGEYIILTTHDVVEAIHRAWNYEFDVFEKKTGNLIFSGNEDNEGNSEMLEPYGIRLIDDGNRRRLQNMKTGEIYKADWEK